MQAVRQCSRCARCAVGGLLRNQTDISLLQRREGACIRFLSSSEMRRLGVQKAGDQTNPTQTSSASLSVGQGIWQVENLSHSSLIKRAASLVTESSGTFLTQATSALTDALADYSKAVHSRIAFQRQYLASLGRVNLAEEESLQQAIRSWRAEAAERLNQCKCYESTWNNAVNLCKMAADAAYSSGAQKASISARANIQMAQSQLEEARKLSAEADKKLAETKVEEIQRMAEYAAFRANSEEHEMHEAYLRED
ncbi:diablo IAP-binding mitochondrial protein-like isoform X1 [Cololabis saira]|uniref:diablo IAP-binding mitochondrial protein-like isoform X1 n=1 Tax=Cololabis saira TaxID=129043 RepID=UPI002AD45FCB|nr:diablo IAP-binding mitochondrial protein-like isoform X1 [Cololabis saira]